MTRWLHGLHGWSVRRLQRWHPWRRRGMRRQWRSSQRRRGWMGTRRRRRTRSGDSADHRCSSLRRCWLLRFVFAVPVHVSSSVQGQKEGQSVSQSVVCLTGIPFNEHSQESNTHLKTKGQLHWQSLRCWCGVPRPPACLFVHPPRQRPQRLQQRQRGGQRRWRTAASWMTRTRAVTQMPLTAPVAPLWRFGCPLVIISPPLNCPRNSTCARGTE